MTRGDDANLSSVVGRGLAVLVLGWAHLRSRRPASLPTPRRRTAALAATTAPVAILGRTLCRADTCWSPPPSPTGRALLVGWVGSGVLVEELAWRAPLLHLSPGRARSCGALVSIAAFSAAHLRRDGLRSAPIHLPTAVGWTLATLLEGRVCCALISHTAYNLAALSIRSEASAPHARRLGRPR